MDVRVAGESIGAFVALIVAVLLIGAVLYARRRGHRISRGALIAVAALIFLLIAYSMTGGFLPFR